MNRIRAGWRALCLIWALALSPGLAADSAATATRPTAAATRPADGGVRLRDRPPEEQRNRLVAFLILAMVVLIVIAVGVLLAMFIVRHGRRVLRRRPEPTELEDLWFLKQDDDDDQRAGPDR